MCLLNAFSLNNMELSIKEKLFNLFNSENFPFKVDTDRFEKLCGLCKDKNISSIIDLLEQKHLIVEVYGDIGYIIASMLEEDPLWRKKIESKKEQERRKEEEREAKELQLVKEQQKQFEKEYEIEQLALRKKREERKVEKISISFTIRNVSSFSQCLERGKSYLFGRDDPTVIQAYTNMFFSRQLLDVKVTEEGNVVVTCDKASPLGTEYFWGSESQELKSLNKPSCPSTSLFLETSRTFKCEWGKKTFWIQQQRFFISFDKPVLEITLTFE